eukprot:4988553-Prorocentrum_lima.AAC.1
MGGVTFGGYDGGVLYGACCCGGYPFGCGGLERCRGRAFVCVAGRSCSGRGWLGGRGVVVVMSLLVRCGRR